MIYQLFTVWYFLIPTLYYVHTTYVLLLFQACGGYFIMFLLMFCVCLFAVARLFTSVWLQIWLDHGDGLEEERRQNMTKMAEKGITPANLTETEMKGFVTDHPDLWMFQLVHVMSLVVLMIIGFIKGFSLAVR